MNGDVSRFNRGVLTVGRWSLGAAQVVAVFIAILGAIALVAPATAAWQSYQYFAKEKWLGPEPPWGQGRIREKYHIRRLEHGAAWHGLAVLGIGLMFWSIAAVALIDQFVGKPLTGAWAIIAFASLVLMAFSAVSVLVAVILSVILSRHSKSLLESAEMEYEWHYGSSK